jgi:hypothetical protein
VRRIQSLFAGSGASNWQENATNLGSLFISRQAGGPDSAKPVNPFSFLPGRTPAANGRKATG